MQDILDRVRERIQQPATVTSMSKRPHHRYPLQPPTTAEAIAAAEAKIGVRLPPLLHAIYSEIANGGIGPGYGLIGVAGTPYHRGWAYNDDTDTVPDLAATYLDVTSCTTYWPPQLVPVCDWGCMHASAIDCSNPQFPVVFDALDHVFCLHSPSFEAWIEDWVAGVDLWQRGFAGERLTFNVKTHPNRQ